MIFETFWQSFGTIRHTEPPPVGLYSPWLRLVLALLKSCCLNYLSVLVAHSLSAVEHFESANLLGIAIEVLAFDLLQ